MAGECSAFGPDDESQHWRVSTSRMETLTTSIEPRPSHPLLLDFNLIA